MLKLSRAVVVEGKYDVARLSSLIDAPILKTDGFGIFRDREMAALIRKYAQECGIIVLTDSDSAGRLIRSHILSIAGKDADVVNLYIPKISGKERRKEQPSREGLLGVEGMESEVLTALFSEYLASSQTQKEPLLREDLYAWGLFGADGAKEKRMALLRELSLPEELNVNQILSSVSFLIGRERVLETCNKLFQSEKKE